MRQQESSRPMVKTSEKGHTPTKARKTPTRQKALKELLDTLVLQYKTPDYIPSDPISIPHRFLPTSLVYGTSQEPFSFKQQKSQNWQTCELVAFITAMFSYGRRDLIIPTVNGLIDQMTGQSTSQVSTGSSPPDTDPMAFLKCFNPKQDAKRFNDFVYRFNKGPDIIFLLQRLQWAYQEYESLENLFIEAAKKYTRTARLTRPLIEHRARRGSQNTDPPSESDLTLRERIGAFIDMLTGLPAGEGTLPSYGLKFLFAHPANGGPCKRMNMFLRWMVRQDEPGTPRIDLGLWRQALSPAELMIPLDTHVTQMNKHFKFTARQTGSWETAEEITAALRRFCPEDPVKYDYALMGFSLSGAHKL